jgi:cytosine/adenosine deaminase-related metal-dependent hydrolase
MAGPSFIIKDVRIFTGEKTIDNGYVLVEDGKIKSFGSSAPSNIGSNVKTISKPGHTLLPGFIDAHNHADKANPKALPQALRFGVTTFMDMHNEIPNVTKLRKQSKENPADAADFKTCGIAATIENGWPIPVVTALDKSPEVSLPDSISCVPF